MFVRPVVEPLTQRRRSPSSQRFVGAVVYWFMTVLPNGLFGKFNGAIDERDAFARLVVGVAPGGLCPITT